MQTVCQLNKCAGCMACVDICPKKAITIQDSLDSYNAVIDTELCVNCQACHMVCPNNNCPTQREPQKWYQGWAGDKSIRCKCSSGGLATAISEACIESGGHVYGCCFEKGIFLFKKASQISELASFSGSKYVKSNPAGCYKDIRDSLKKGERVLFIGLPCQVAAVRNFVGEKLDQNLYTADLICHGTPSPKLLDVFLNQYKKQLSSFDNILFRIKAKMQIHCDGEGIVRKGVSDRYTIAFLNGLTYTDNCYKCQFAQRKRVSDITLGDSWGSELPLESMKEGVSLALCQTRKGIEILENADVELLSVDLENAILNNQQLDHPSIMPKDRVVFFESLKKGYKFNKLVKKYLPKQCFRQDIKALLIRMRIRSAGGKSSLIYGIIVNENSNRNEP